MLGETLIRTVVGGAMVSVFALVGDVIKPKRFAGLFGAAPSVALASLLLAVKTQSKIYAAIEARSMVAGAIAFFVYSYSVYWVSMRYKTTALVAALSHIAIWVVVAFGIWLAWLKG
jgi:uncharacterized membrane protein (GlpM family)